MAKIQDEILETFLAQLEKTDAFSKERVKKLRQVFTSGKKPKAEDLVRILSEEPKEHLS